MKYFRTKDAIYSYEPIHDIDVDGFVIQHNITGWSKPIMKEDIVKITDTIEKLCDEFVLINKKDKTHFIDTLPPDIYNYKDFIVYGAIWCEWGLKYVARMNSKGELELL